MKKVRTGILAAALLLSIGVTGALAAGPGWGRHAGWNNCPASDASLSLIHIYPIALPHQNRGAVCAAGNRLHPSSSNHTALRQPPDLFFRT